MTILSLAFSWFVVSFPSIPVLPHPHLLALVVWLIAWAAIMVAAYRGYAKQGRRRGYFLFAVGFTILIGAFALFDPATQSAEMYPAAGIGLLIMFASGLIRRKKSG